MFSLFGLKLVFAGIGPMIWHWGIGVGVIIIILIIEFAAGWLVSMAPWLAKPVAWVQKHLLLICIGIVMFLGGQWIGAHDMAKRCDAKAQVVVREVHKVVIKATTKANSGKYLDKWDTNQ